MGKTVTKKAKKATVRSRAPGKRPSKPPSRFQGEQAASDSSESDGQGSGPNTRSSSRLRAELIAEQEKRDRRAERKDGSDRSSLLGAAAALERQQEPSEFAKALQKRVALAMQPSEPSESSSSSDSDDESGQMHTAATDKPAKVNTAVQQTVAEVHRADSVLSEENFEALQRRQSVVERQLETILAYVRSLTDSVAKRDGDSRGVQPVVHTTPSAVFSDARASVASSVVSSRFSLGSTSDRGSKASSRTVGTQTEAAPAKSKSKEEKRRKQGRETQTREVSVKKSGESRVSLRPKASKPASKAERAKRERDKEDNTDPSSSEPDDSSSSSSSDSDAPPPKDKYKTGRKEKMSQKESRRRATDIKAPTYSGDAYVEQFLKQFRTRARLAGWPKDEWGSRLLISLEGKARGILTTSDLPDEPSFKQLSALLKKRFGGEASSQVWRATLSQRKRGERESLTELAHSIMEAVVKAYPKRDDEARQDLATTYFINALVDEGQQQHINTHEVDTLEQATKLAVAYENARRVSSKRAGPFRPRVHLIGEESDWEAPRVQQVSQQGQNRRGSQEDQLSKKIDDLAKTVAALATKINGAGNCTGPSRPQVAVLGRGGPSRNTAWSNGRSGPYHQQRQISYGPPATGYTGCFVCGDLGHFSRECPNRFSSPGNAQSRPSAKQGAGQNYQ